MAAKWESERKLPKLDLKRLADRLVAQHILFPIFTMNVPNTKHVPKKLSSNPFQTKSITK